MWHETIGVFMIVTEIGQSFLNRLEAIIEVV